MKKIAVVAGGNSGEYEVSLKSGRMVMQSLDPELFVPYYLVIKAEDWKLEFEGNWYPVNKADFSVSLPNGEILRFDAAYLIIHGTPGEDGIIQGYFSLLGIPFIGPGITCCSLTSSKSLSKDLVAAKGIPTAKSRILKRNSKPDWAALANELGLPLFIKPNSGGSSVATHKVYKTEELEAAFLDAAVHDAEVLAEEFVQGRELTCGIFDNGQELVCLPITEIKPHNDFFDYRAKYMGESDEITPADIDTSLLSEINELTRKVYRILHCDAMVRIDFMIRGNVPYFMEVNTIPGFSEASIVPQQLRAAGLNVTDTLTAIINRKLNV